VPCTCQRFSLGSVTEERAKAQIRPKVGFLFHVIRNLSRHRKLPSMTASKTETMISTHIAKLKGDSPVLFQALVSTYL
jgi:hypothetical protein